MDIAHKSEKGLLIGFNRRFSSISNEIKHHLDQLPGPTFLRILVNAGSLPNNHWLLDPNIGGGRIIGECIHFIDLARFFIGNQSKSVKKHKLFKGEDSQGNVNFSIKFTDGSIAQISYITIGNDFYPKEHIELIKNGTIVTINNFQSATLISPNGKIKKIRKKDKGYDGELEYFAEMLLHSPSLKLTLDEIIDVHNIAFQIDG